jgi:phosphoserine phosphatase RsbU/P
VLYKPKDVVSGDFYTFIQKDDFILIAAADCTGHGVPGAFMSMIGNEQLSKIISEKGITTPSDILNELHNGVRKALKQDHVTGESRDGMDIALCKINLKQNKLEYAGANRPLWIIRKKELMETKADKQPIGGLETEHRKPFTNHTIPLEPEDCIYLFTDGFADQFGGDKGKKFMVKNFERQLTEINNESMEKQHSIIQEKFEAWKGNHEQVDDVLVIGIRI